MAVLSEFERDLVSERTAAAMSVKRSNGQRISGRIPFGFSLHSDGVRLVEHPEEQRVIDSIKSMRSHGATLKRIAEQLRERGIRTKTGRTIWEPKTLSQILARARA